MGSGNKADILECLNAPHSRSVEAKSATVIVLDMTAVVHMIRPTTANTFMDYVSMHLVPYLESQLLQLSQGLMQSGTPIQR